MKPEELDSGIAQFMNVTAAALAKKHNLICTDGTIVCWECRKRVALMPSLHCHLCLSAKRGYYTQRDEREREHVENIASGKVRPIDVPKDWNDPEKDHEH